MSTEENKAIFRSFLDAFDKGDMDTLSQIVAPNVIDHAGPPGMPPGIEGFKQLAAMLRMAFPDVYHTIDDMIAERDKVVLRGSFGGTHKGEFLGIPATGKQVMVMTIDILRIADGKVMEHWGQFDALGLMQQLGVMPSPGQGAA